MSSSMDLDQDTPESIEVLRPETGQLQLHAFPPTEKVQIPVEVCLKSSSTARSDEVRTVVERMLEQRSLTYVDGPIPLLESDDLFLLNNVESISMCFDGRPDGNEIVLFWQVKLNVHVYQLLEDGPWEGINEDGDLTSFQGWSLPAKEFHGLWESLICDPGLKHRLLRYASSGLQFADKKVDPNIVSWNRVVLLHGPPGSGKTSLCKALAQKLAIYFSDRYPEAQLLEVNVHSLFSKWFSESGKLVTKLFQKIQELVQDGNALAFILIDEVESLVAARQAALSGSEPSDAIRVVNSLLTQLDKLKSWPNVFVLATSNITAAIDVAFVDRADIKAYVGPPSVHARYDILKSCMKELFRSGILQSEHQDIAGYKDLKDWINKKGKTSAPTTINPSLQMSEDLLRHAEACEGFSGRTLRKLPFLAHASLSSQCDGAKFLEALQAVIRGEISDRDSMTTSCQPHNASR